MLAKAHDSAARLGAEAMGAARPWSRSAADVAESGQGSSTLGCLSSLRSDRGDGDRAGVADRLLAGTFEFTERRIGDRVGVDPGQLSVA